METAASQEACITCPSCGSDAAYKYGHAMGRQRYLCLGCNRQYVPDCGRRRVEDKPDCPACGKRMHLYMREEGVLRFRCSDYPRCKTYLKVTLDVQGEG